MPDRNSRSAIYFYDLTGLFQLAKEQYGSVAELARRLCIHPQTLYNAFSGFKVSPGMAARLARHFGVDIATLRRPPKEYYDEEAAFGHGRLRGRR